MITRLATPRPLLLRAAIAPLRSTADVSLFGGKEWDGKSPSKCPFTGGANGGGLGDFNLVTFGAIVFAVAAWPWCPRACAR